MLRGFAGDTPWAWNKQNRVMQTLLECWEGSLTFNLLGESSLSHNSLQEVDITKAAAASLRLRHSKTRIPLSPKLLSPSPRIRASNPPTGSKVSSSNLPSCWLKVTCKSWDSWNHSHPKKGDPGPPRSWVTLNLPKHRGLHSFLGSQSLRERTSQPKTKTSRVPNNLCRTESFSNCSRPRMVHLGMLSQTCEKK